MSDFHATQDTNIAHHGPVIPYHLLYLTTLLFGGDSFVPSSPTATTRGAGIFGGEAAGGLGVMAGIRLERNPYPPAFASFCCLRTSNMVSFFDHLPPRLTRSVSHLPSLSLSTYAQYA